MTHQHPRDVGTGYFTVARTYVCFPCRYTAKAGSNEQRDRRCPHCQKPLINCGQNFKPPRKQDDRRWRSSEAKFAHKHATE